MSKALEDMNGPSLSILKPNSTIEAISEYNKNVNNLTNQVSEAPLSHKDLYLIRKLIDIEPANLPDEELKCDCDSSSIALN